MNFDFSVDFYLTYNILTVPSFRIGVPSILFITLEIKTFGLGSRMNRFWVLEGRTNPKLQPLQE